MRNAVLIAFAVLATASLFAFVAPPESAISAGSADPRIAALQKQVKTLQAQVKRLNTRVSSIDQQLGLNWEGDTCLGAQVADLIQGTWGVVDQLSAATQAGKTYFGPQTQVDDYGNCADLARPDVPRLGIRVPPVVDSMRLLLQWLHIDLATGQRG
jgi:hypothetical protein